MHPSNDEAPETEIPRWRRCMLAVSMFFTVAAFGFLEPFVPLYLELSGLERGEIGLVSGIGPGLALLIQPLLGKLSDRLDARRPIMLGAALAAGCAYSAYRFADGLLSFVLLTAVGVNAVMYLNTANAVLVGRVASRHGNGAACGGTFAAYRVWGSVGYVVISLLSGWLLGRSAAAHAAMDRAAVAPIFLYGPLLFVLVAVVVALLPDPRHRVAATAQAGSASDGTDGPRPLCARNLNRFLHAYFLFLFAYSGCGAYISLYLRSLGATPFWITATFAAGVVCEVLVMTQAGRLSDRYGRRPVLAIAFLFLPVRLGLYILASSPAGVMAVQTIHGLNFGVMAVVASIFIGDLCSESNRGTMQARLTATSGIAGATGPAVGGWIAQEWGIRWTFGIMACMAALAAVTFLWRVRESHTRSTRLYRLGPPNLRPLLGVLCVPGRWLVRHSVVLARRRRSS